jgi:uncharacterized protein (DUF58 family)
MSRLSQQPEGAGTFSEVSGGRRSFFWRRLLWALVFPRRGQRVMATVPGVVLIALAMGVGMAAYNSASNILFITLSLLLGCLILSGVLSWLNFRGLAWRLEVDSPMRAGRAHRATLFLRNEKRLLPTQSLAFEVSNTSGAKPRQLRLRERLDPQGEARLDWTVCPARRGVERVELAFVGSLFPFGFLRKSLAGEASCDVLVWPAPVAYRRFPVAAWRRVQPGEPVARSGQNGDLLTLRNYQAGDSHRQIHWKASARLRKLVVRQFSTDSEEAFVLWLRTTATLWKNAEQFERLCSFAATLAEDLFKQGKLDGVAVDQEPATPVRGGRDVEAFLDRLAMLQPVARDAEAPVTSRPARKHSLTFEPDGSRGVVAYVDGEKAAAA